MTAEHSAYEGLAWERRSGEEYRQGYAEARRTPSRRSPLTPPEVQPRPRSPRLTYSSPPDRVRFLRLTLVYTDVGSRL
jgi:hypothetical protein